MVTVGFTDERALAADCYHLEFDGRRRRQLGQF
jgi:hypothetical protein